MQTGSVEELGCTSIAYVYGGVTLSPKPPLPFNVGVKVEVGVVQAAVSEPQRGERHLLWNYFAVVKPGLVSVRCSIGDIYVEKRVEARASSTEILNFCFGDPVQVGPVSKMRALKVNSERKLGLRSSRTARLE